MSEDHQDRPRQCWPHSVGLNMELALSSIVQQLASSGDSCSVKIVWMTLGIHFKNDINILIAVVGDLYMDVLQLKCLFLRLVFGMNGLVAGDAMWKWLGDPCALRGLLQEEGVASSKNDGFSLSSGDFPTLGSESESVGKSTDLQGDTSVNENAKSRTLDTWRRDDSQHAEDGLVPPTVGKWEGDHPPPYLNANVPPQHFEAWHGRPINPPPGVWYRGLPGGPPYAAPLAPGGFPIEPFPFYSPQIPPAALANSPGPPPGAGPRGHHPHNGDRYRPHIPDAYIRPGMPIRPGFYPGPVAYEGYYHPPMGYCNPSEHDFPFMGMAAGPNYNRYPGENVPDPGNNHARAGLHGSTGKASVPEQVESGHHDDTRGPYKVLLKQHNEWDEKREENKREHSLPANAHAPYLGKGDRPMTLSQKNEWGMEDRNDEEIYSGRRVLGGDASSQNFDNRGRTSSDSVTEKLLENRAKAETEDNRSASKSENAASTVSQAPQVFPATPKDSTLIQKIEGLNAKARASDGWPDVASVPSREEQKSRSQVVDTKVNCLINDSGTGAVGFGTIRTIGNIIPASHDVDISTSDKTLQTTASSVTTISRGASHGVQGRLDHRGKRFNTHDADGWRKKPLATESTIAVSTANLETSSNMPVEDHLPFVEPAEKHGIKLKEKDEDESDDQAQRAKMREIAKQRALQLQKEEEERVREQKAKALAKLAELNRRTQATDGSIQKLEKAPLSGPIQQEQEECQLSAEQVMVASKSKTPSPALVSNPEDQIIKSNTAVRSTVMSTDTHLETSDNVHSEPLPLRDGQNASAADSKAAARVNEGSTSRHKHMGYKQKQNVSLGKNLAEKSIPVSSTEAPKNHADMAVTGVACTEVVAGEVGLSCESSLPMNPNIMTESAAHQRRKNNKSSKNKHKLDDVPSVTVLPSTVPKEINVEKVSAESGGQEGPELEVDISSVRSRTDAKTAVQPPEQQPSLPSEEACGNGNGKQNKQSKTHGSWQQRGSVESTFVPDLQDGSLSTSKPSKNIRKSIEPDQSLKPDVNSMKEQLKSSDDLNTYDGWNRPENPDIAAPVTSALVKDRGVTDRGKRHPFKGHRSMGNSNDHDPRNSNKSSSDSPAPEIGQTDKTIVSKENRGAGERTTSHWQPKSQAYSVHNQRGNRPGGGQSVTIEVSKAIRNDSPSQDSVQLPPHHNKEVGEHTVQPSIDPSVAEQKNVAKEPNVGHQESKRERKVAAFRGRPRTPNQSSVNVEPAPTESMDTHNEQGFASGFRKNASSASSVVLLPHQAPSQSNPPLSGPPHLFPVAICHILTPMPLPCHPSSLRVRPSHLVVQCVLFCKVKWNLNCSKGSCATSPMRPVSWNTGIELKQFERALDMVVKTDSFFSLSIPLFLTVNIAYGAEVSKVLIPLLWVFGPLIVALHIKMLQVLCALYVSSFKQTIKSAKSIPTCYALAHNYIDRGKLKEEIRSCLWYRAVEKYMNFFESIRPNYRRTISSQKRAKLI
ncbi:modifier of snc1 [Actinidia rufa]|uniref:Modifier of snc1 n=1 Tax=Actinidia rufa TaxID=165716 RepID=A0A7J0H2W8_9ERIC|nr:modifier of snc1 [Actinidia rufa]